MLKRLVVNKNERGALLRDGEFGRILNAGRHYFWDPLDRLSLVTWKLDAPMTATDIADDCFEPMEPSEDEAGPGRVSNGLVSIKGA